MEIVKGIGVVVLIVIAAYILCDWGQCVLRLWVLEAEVKDLNRQLGNAEGRFDNLKAQIEGQGYTVFTGDAAVKKEAKKNEFAWPDEFD